MFKKIILSLIPVLAFTQTKIDYKLFYSDKLETEGLKVQVSFKSKEETDSTYFHYSNQKWGEMNLINCIKILKDENPNYKFKLVGDSNRIVVYHPKTKNISFFYHIIQDYKGDDPMIFFRPKIKNNFFHILGENLFTVPETIFEKNVQNPKIKTTIEWINFPDDFKIHNTFDTNQKKQTLKVDLWHQLYHSLFVGGDYRIYSFSYQNKPIYFAIRDQWLNEYQDEKLLEALKKAIFTQREFWKDNDFDYYTVIMTPTISQRDSTYRGQSINGTGLSNGFMIQSSNNPFNDWNSIRYVFNHEMMHDWIGGKIKMKNGDLNYWFSEGFTDYYTYKNRLRNKDITFKEWLDDFNKDVIKEYWKNPEKNKANYVIKDNYWNNRDIQKIPYQRGAIFAFWLDNQILKKSNYTKSLDDLMREMFAICSTENKKFTDEFFLELAQKYIDQNINLDYFFQKHILCGEDMELKNEDLIDGFKIIYSEKIPQIKAEETIINKYIIN